MTRKTPPGGADRVRLSFFLMFTLLYACPRSLVSAGSSGQANAAAASLAPSPVEEKAVRGRKVTRFEHESLKSWGYAGNSRQYFYLVEPQKLIRHAPLIVILHSAGGDAAAELDAYIERPLKDLPEFYGLVPNCGEDVDHWWGADAVRRNGDRYANALTPVENRLLAIVRWALDHHDIDPDRVYLRGISMGGTGALGLGIAHGDIFASIYAGVPAGFEHALTRMDLHGEAPKAGANSPARCDAPPILMFASQADNWSQGLERFLQAAQDRDYALVFAWGPWGHLNHYEMTNPAAFEFPWLELRRNVAYPVFTRASTDDRYPGFGSMGTAQDGQINAFFRWATIRDTPVEFSIELRLVQQGELAGRVDLPGEAAANVTLRRLQRFAIQPGKPYDWRLEKAGVLVDTGTVASNSSGLMTIPGLHVTRSPSRLTIRHAGK